MLVHADARDLVERRVGQLAVVGHADLAAVLETGLAHALAGHRGLRLGERDADGVDAVVAGGVHDERAPPAAEVEEPLAGGEAQLAADALELALLGGVEALVGVGEDRA